MVRIKQAIVVEGRYDKNTLSQIVDTPILQTDGFGIMKDKQQLQLLRRVARSRGLIVFTDSDGAGFVIRNFLKAPLNPSTCCMLTFRILPVRKSGKQPPVKRESWA